jgi:hypothetical protein
MMERVLVLVAARLSVPLFSFAQAIGEGGLTFAPKK